MIIKTEDKLNYFSVLRQADAGMITPFIEYIAQNLLRSLEIMIKGAKVENLEEPEDLDKEIALLEQKIKGAGNKIEITKSKEAILEIYDDTLARTVNVFIKNCKKFDKFYVKAEFRMWMTPLNLNITDLRAKININITSIALSYKFEAFKQEGFGEFDYTSLINFKFDLTGYKAQDLQRKFSIEKSYGEQLNDEEINALIKAEMKAHQEVIENKIKELKKNKK